MELAEALDIVVARTGHARYRDLCNPEHPAYNAAYIPIVLAMARAAESPSTPRVVGNALGAAGRVVAAVARGERVRVSSAVHAERLAICHQCEFNRLRPTGVKCSRCGCGELKLSLATERC